MTTTAPAPATRRSPDLGGTGPTRGRILPGARAADGASLLRLLAVTGIVTVLGIRAYLAQAGYPQIGNATFHIAHALWGGLLLLVGLATTLLFVSARRVAAVLGGIGLGLFIDEVGKLVSRQSDYFFPLAPALMYLVFAGLLVWSALWDRDTARRGLPRARTERSDGHPTDPAGMAGTASAAQIAVDGIGAGLTAEQRQAAERLLAGRDDRTTRAVRALLDSAPEAPPAPWYRTSWARFVDRARALAHRPQVRETVFGLFLASRLVIPLTVLIRLIVLLASGRLAADQGALGHLGALLGSLAGGIVSAAFAVHATRLWQRRPRDAYRWFKASALVDLLVVAVFNFAGSQWVALVFLPANLIVLAMASWLLHSETAPEHPRGLVRALAGRLAQGARRPLRAIRLRLRRGRLGSRGDRTRIPSLPARPWRPGRLRRRGRRLDRRPRRWSRQSAHRRPRARALTAHLPRRTSGRLDRDPRPSG